MKRTKKVSEIAKQVKKGRKKGGEKSSPLLLVPTGATMLNLACADNVDGGWGVGKIVNLIGDSSSGKTMLAFTMFADMARMKKFDDYRFIYDDVEQALEFNVDNLFGKKVASRIEAPAYDEDGQAVHSDLVQDFFAYIQKAINKGKPFIYVLDSFDALTSKEEVKKVDETLKAHLRGTKTEGSYNVDKPKAASQILRSVKSKIKDTGSLIIVISQTRDNIGFGFEKKTRSGGKALKFYSSHEIWLAMVGQIMSKKRVIGNNVNAKITKNKITGKRRVVSFPIYYDYGVDSIASEIDFLIEEGYWRGKGEKVKKIKVPEFNFEGSRRALIKKIEEEGLEQRLREITGKAWMEIEESLKLKRKAKYD